MDLVENFLVPLAEIVIIFGVLGLFLFFLGKGLHNAWSKSIKYVWKYKIRRKKYLENTLKWILDCMNEGIGYYDAKKMLMIKMHSKEQINETMWIYDQMINEWNRQKK